MKENVFYFCKICPVYTTVSKEEKAKSRKLKLADVNAKSDVTFGVTSILRNVYVKCLVHLFRWNIFHSLRYEHKILTNRTAGNQMNITKINLNHNIMTNWHNVMIQSQFKRIEKGDEKKKR